MSAGHGGVAPGPVVGPSGVQGGCGVGGRVPPVEEPLVWLGYEVGVFWSPGVGSDGYSVDEMGCFCAGGVSVGTELVGVASANYLEVGEPGDAFRVVSVWLHVCVWEGCANIVGVYVPVEEGGHLSSGDVIRWAKLPVRATEGAWGASHGDFVGDCPADGLVRVDPFCYVGEGF